MTPFAIVTAADGKFFDLLQGLVASIREKPEGRTVPIYVLDAGLTEPEKAWLGERGASAVAVAWPYEFDVPGPQRVLARRCQIPSLVPAHNLYIWLDADTWVQDWAAVELYCRTAEDRHFCMAAEVNGSFDLADMTQWNRETSQRLFGPAIAHRLASKPLLNAGVFAARADAPHWTAWQKRVQEAVSSSVADFYLDQTALNIIAYVDGFDVAVLPARYNWPCHRALPCTTDDGATLVDPQPPYQRLGIIHMTTVTKRENFVLRTISGGLIARSLRYASHPRSAFDPANPVAAEIRLAQGDSMSQWHERAARRVRRLVTEYPENVEVLAALAEIAMSNDCFGEAVRAFRRAAALQPDNVSLKVRLGDAYVLQGRYDEAVSTFHDALRLSPGNEPMERHLKALVAARAFPPGDYVSPGLLRVNVDKHFPNMVRGDPRENAWAYMRRNSPHNWYVDKRAKNIGFVSRDEAHILFNTALRFEGMRALEIGCFLGFSTCHLALGGVKLDVVDPILRDPPVIESVAASLISAGVIDDCRLIPSPSPASVEILGGQEGRTWSLAFIDGDHDGAAPRRDAQVCERFLKADALVLFHDLLSPDVAAGLRFFRERGWQTRIYRTSQIMGVAWRGAVQPIEHVPDPALPMDLPPHLAEWAIG